MELHFSWPGACEGLNVHLSSTRSLRRLLSTLRIANATPQGVQGPADTAARFPISGDNEEATHRQLLEILSRRPQNANEQGWKKLERFASSVLDAIATHVNRPSLAHLTVIVHAESRALVGAATPCKQAASIVNEAVELRDSGGSKGRGYYAAKSVEIGELVLLEQPYIFDEADDDSTALAAMHVIFAREMGFDLRPAPGEADEACSRTDIYSWFRNANAVTSEEVTEAYMAARNNGFRSSLTHAFEAEPMLLFFKLCMFNHSCVPNCAMYRDTSSGLSRVLTIRPVKAGDELTIHYDDNLLLLPSDLRRTFLRGRFGFDCDCSRCMGDDPMSALTEAALTKMSAETADSSEEEQQARLHNMRKAHAGICIMKTERGSPVGFAYREFDSWTVALTAVEAAMPQISNFGAPTFWSRHHLRELRCMALEGLERDSQAFLTLAEHADAAWRLLPPFCEGLRQLWIRFQNVRGRLPVPLQKPLLDRAMNTYGEGISGLEKDMQQLTRWLELSEVTNST